MSDSGGMGCGTKILLAALVLGGGGFVASFGGFWVMCCGASWMIAPGPVIAETEVMGGTEFSLSVDASTETARTVFLEFEAEYPISVQGDGSETWGLTGWVEIDGMTYELDIARGADGVIGHPSDWEEFDLKESTGFAWGQARGELLLGSVMPATADGEQSEIKGMIWGTGTTSLGAARVFVRE